MYVCSIWSNNNHLSRDLNTRRRTGTGCRVAYHFSIESDEFRPLYTLFRFHIFVRAIVLVTKHNYKISTSFIQTNRRCNRVNIAKWISIRTTLSECWLAKTRTTELKKDCRECSCQFSHKRVRLNCRIRIIQCFSDQWVVYPRQAFQLALGFYFLGWKIKTGKLPGGLSTLARPYARTLGGNTYRLSCG